MSNEILGYCANGAPIRQIKPGYIATQAFVLCCRCGAPIRAVGGPITGAVCVPCHDAAMELTSGA